MTIQVFTVEEGMAIKNNAGTTVFDVTNAGNMTVDGTSALQGATTFGSGGTAFTFPTTDGGANQALITDGAGNVTWANGKATRLTPVHQVTSFPVFGWKKKTKNNIYTMINK